MPVRTYHLIPHTHWDREWYLTRATFVSRLIPALDDLIARLETDATFRSFVLDGQTVLLEDYLSVRPEMAPRVRPLVASGRLQVGPWYVLADELIPSGESLIRNLLAGRADAERFGGRLDVLYSPDAFGHPAAWPALAAEFGIRYGVLWRGLGGEPGQDGDLFRWRAPDGREVFLHHLSSDGYEAGASLPVDPVRLGPAWKALKAQLEPRARTSHVAVFMGADHHAAHPAVGRVRELLTELEPRAEVKVSRLDEYLAAAEASAEALPILEGELRWSYGYTWTLQGVHATRAPLKRRHGEAELSLERLTEPLAALALWQRGLDARPLLDRAWRTLLRSQFHDSLAGCTSDVVAERVTARVGDALAMSRELARGAFHGLIGYDPDAARERPADTSPRIIFYNPAPRRRRAVVVADLTWFRRDVLVGPPGTRVARRADSPSDADIAAALEGFHYQILSRRQTEERLDSARHYPDQDEVEAVRVALATPELGGLGLVSGKSSAAPVKPVRTASRLIDNGILEVAFTADGLVRLTDRRTAARYERLLSLESEGDAGDTYSFAPAARVGPEVARWSDVRTLAEGPLLGALEATASLRSGTVGARLILALYGGSPMLRCTVLLDNEARGHRLRIRLPTALGSEAVAGGPFGPVRRAPVSVTGRRYPRETPVPTAPAQRFVATAGPGGGLAVLAPGFFEYEHDAAGDLTVTLLRCVGQLSRDDLQARPGHAGWPTPTPGAQSLGWERLQLALAPVTGDDVRRVTPVAELWEDAFLPPHAVWLRQSTELSIPEIDVR
ncbi:MAG TPA: glycoside hydrolase family 38 C-terminal domain-containing protein, partial [Gemmatimonadales bacterium]|nr:glycoside hydrolase family 38 C-terminal domain-containing protein [Gemmatimonadales bacterium]